MADTSKTFKVFYNKIPVQITPGRIGEQIAYTASYGGSPIILTRSTDPEGHGFWASVPDVNNSLVEGLGRLIQDHLNLQE